MTEKEGLLMSPDDYIRVQLFNLYKLQRILPSMKTARYHAKEKNKSIKLCLILGPIIFIPLAIIAWINNFCPGLLFYSDLTYWLTGWPPWLNLLCLIVMIIGLLFICFGFSFLNEWRREMRCLWFLFEEASRIVADLDIQEEDLPPEVVEDTEEILAKSVSVRYGGYIGPLHLYHRSL